MNFLAAHDCGIGVRAFQNAVVLQLADCGFSAFVIRHDRFDGGGNRGGRLAAPGDEEAETCANPGMRYT